MKLKMIDFVSCDHLLWSLSRMMLIELTINQWHDATLTCCLSVNWHTSLNNESPVYSIGGESSKLRGESVRVQTSHGANSPGANQQRGEKAIIPPCPISQQPDNSRVIPCQLNKCSPPKILDFTDNLPRCSLYPCMQKCKIWHLYS